MTEPDTSSAAGTASAASAAGTTIEERASKMLAGTIKAGDLAPRVRTMLQVTLETLVRLADRVAELEKSPMRYEGVHESGRQYTRGQFVSVDGSIWHANRTTTSRPGDGGPAWTLAVKRGKDSQR